MKIRDDIKSWMHLVVEEVKSTLPDDIHFDFRKHVLPLFFPFLGWKDELRKPEVLKADFMAGLIGAVIVLPQGIAFAMIAGLPPVYGLYTAMVVPIIAALFGSSWHAVSGPTAPISLVVFAAVAKLAPVGSQEYIDKVLMITFLAGLIQLVMGLGRLGRYISFVSQAVIIGFTAGAAVLTITNQMESALGLDIRSGASFYEVWNFVYHHVPDIQIPVLLVTVYTLIASLVVKRLLPRSPYLLAGLALGTAFAWLLGGPELGIPFTSEIPRKLPSFSMPEFSASNFYHLLNDAFAVALLGIIQTVAIGRAIATQSGQQINGNQEFFGQGLSNMVGSFFSCYASSGSFTRSGLNYQSGARTPMSAIFSAVLLAVLVLTLAPLARYLPIPAISGIILLIGWGLIDFGSIRGIRKASKRDNLILGATFFATLLSELDFAVMLGVLLSLFFFLRRTSMPNIAVMAPDSSSEKHGFVNLIRKDVPVCPQMKIIRIDGQVYFGAIDHIATRVREFRRGPEKFLMILASGINDVDLDGAEWLYQESAYWRKKGGALIVVRMKRIALDILENGGYLQREEGPVFFDSKTTAISSIYNHFDLEICKKCPHRVFLECAGDPRLPVLHSAPPPSE